MAVYTTEVRTICEQFASQSLPEDIVFYDVPTIIREAEPRIFTFTYPIWEGGDIHDLNREILFHFYFQEIGLETYGLWKTFLMRKLQERMPYYQKLYPTTVKNYDYLNDFYIKEIINRTGNRVDSDNKYRKYELTRGSKTDDNVNEEYQHNVTDTTSTTNHQTTHDSDIANTTINSSTAYSDFPQALVTTGQDFASRQDMTKGNNSDAHNIDGSIEGSSSITRQMGDTNGGFNTRTTKLEGTDDISETHTNTLHSDTIEDVIREQYGNQGGYTPTQLIEQYRQSILEIYPLIMEDLNELFMTLW